MTDIPSPCGECLCVACDCVDLGGFYTPAGAGPFCSERWEALNDPDQALLTEKRLAEAEEAIEELTAPE